MTALRSTLIAMDGLPSTPEDAYVGRIQLKRLLLRCLRGIANARGLVPPDSPTDVAFMPLDDPLVQLYKDVYARAHRILLPSESFDTRWKREWNSLRAEIETLVVEVESQISSVEKQSAD